MKKHFAPALLLISLATPTTADWTTHRGNPQRTGLRDAAASALYTADALSKLKVLAEFRLPGPLPGTDEWTNGFWSSPVIAGDRLYIGGGNGYLYALDRKTLQVVWQFPKAGDPALTSKFTCNPSSYGIAASAVVTKIGATEAVIFGAPDQTLGAKLGDGRLFALDAKTGNVLWKSPALAKITGTQELSGNNTDEQNAKAFAEQHEQIGYSAPLVVGDKVYVGTANHCDNPIQTGRIHAVNLADGSLDAKFSFVAGQPRGGGIWSSLASDGTDIFATTGNIRSGVQPGETITVNHALALVHVKGDTGAVVSKVQPVPPELDDDPDWAAGATVLTSTCGTMAVSTMKDGWTYALSAVAQPDTMLWQYPKTVYPFATSDNWTEHGDTRFLRSGVGWKNVFVTMTASLNVNVKKVSNYNRLHGLNACAGEGDRVRWIYDVPNVPKDAAYALGSPTGTAGFFFVGTRTNWLIAFADPSVASPIGYRCQHPDVPNNICTESGFRLVPDPRTIASVQLPGPVSGEPVLADDRIYVATTNGIVAALGVEEPKP